jgi:hypothetical protein
LPQLGHLVFLLEKKWKGLVKIHFQYPSTTKAS